MAIFNSGDSKNQTGQNGSGTTIVTLGAKIKGEMTLECNLFIDGEFEGTIHSQKEVTIGKNGIVRGEVFAQTVIVQGEIGGNVSAKTVVVKPLGKVVGTVESAEFVIEPKGLFEGNSIVKKEENENESLLMREKVD